MKNLNELFIKIAAVSHLSDDESQEAKIRRCGGFFEVTITDAVTESVIRQMFLGELANKTERRWAVIKKNGTHLCCMSRNETLEDALKFLNTYLKGNGIFGFSMEALAELS